MSENKKIIILLGAIVTIILLIVVCSFIENKKSRDYLNDFYSAFNGSEEKLVMIGRDNCSWCQLFKPSLDSMHDKYKLEYLYVNTNELTSSVFKKLLKDVGVDEKEFGTPYTIVVKEGKVVDSLNGYVDEVELLDFLKSHKFVSSDVKLSLNYIDYSGFKNVAKSSENKILVLGQTTCGYCIKAKPILSKIADEYGITINYLNVNTLSSEESGKLSKYVSYLGENQWGTPLTIIVKNGEVIDSANGLLDEEGYVKLFKDNGFIK